MPFRPPKHRPFGWRPPAPKATDPFYGSVEWKALREQVRERDMGRCRGANWKPGMGSIWFCGRPGSRVDHIKPRSEGGPDRTFNLRLLCTACDAKRHIEKTTAWR